MLLLMVATCLPGAIGGEPFGGIAWAQAAPKPALPSAVEAQKQQAIKLFDERRYGEAIPLLQSVLTAAPLDADSHVLLTFAFARVGLLTQAIEQGRRALTVVATNTKLELLLAGLLAQQQQTRQEAIGLYQTVLKRDPDNEVANLGLAEAYRNAGNFVGALQLYHKLVALEPEEAFYNVRLAQTYGGLGYPEQAAPYFEKAYQLDPTNHDALRSLAILDDVNDKPEQAIRRYREILALYPDDAAAQVALLDLERSLVEPRLDRPVAEIQKIPLSTYLTSLESGNENIKGRLDQLSSVDARSKLRFLPQFFINPNYGQFGSLATNNIGFSAGWNLADLFIDNYAVTKKGLQADLSQVRNALAGEVASLYYQRQTDISNYQQIQRALALEPSNVQYRQTKRQLKNSIIAISERLRLMTGLS
jgi:tetratricopeptide (TPR) repeat protein